MVILDRPRHRELIEEVRASGARIRLIRDGDVYGAIATAWPESGVDVLMGIGGTPEGVVAAAALKCMGGEIQGRLWPRDEADRVSIKAAGFDPQHVLTTDDLVRSDNCFFAATGITDGPLLSGVTIDDRGIRTESLVMRSRSGTVRRIEARHRDRQDEHHPRRQRPARSQPVGTGLTLRPTALGRAVTTPRARPWRRARR